MVLSFLLGATRHGSPIFMSEDKPTERKAAPPSAPAQNLQLTIDEAEAQGIYANFAIIAHSNSEVILDFARNLPGLAKAKVHARIILTPPNAKALHRALGENLAKFEAHFGPINLGGANDPEKSIGFRS
jgi:hypothetical protein